MGDCLIIGPSHILLGLGIDTPAISVAINWQFSSLPIVLSGITWVVFEDVDLGELHYYYFLERMNRLSLLLTELVKCHI